MPPYDALEKMARLADRIRGGRQDKLPSLLAMTDPKRTPDPLKLARQLPQASALIYRHFGSPDRFETGEALAEICQKRGLVLLVSADPDLADVIKADGIHWPENDFEKAVRLRARRKSDLFTVSAHSPGAAFKANTSSFDGILYSSVFASKSPSAGRPIGTYAAASATKHVSTPIYALGGVNQHTGRRLIGLGFSGIACVGAVN